MPHWWLAHGNPSFYKYAPWMFCVLYNPSPSVDGYVSKEAGLYYQRRKASYDMCQCRHIMTHGPISERALELIINRSYTRFALCYILCFNDFVVFAWISFGTNIPISVSCSFETWYNSYYITEIEVGCQRNKPHNYLIQRIWYMYNGTRNGAH